MKNTIFILLMILALSSVARADTYDDAVAAYYKEEYSKALKLFRKAAANGSIPAKYNLGVMYAQGKGVKKDFVRAYMWLKLGTYLNTTPEDVKLIGAVSARMTQNHIAEANRMIDKCIHQLYKNCD